MNDDKYSLLIVDDSIPDLQMTTAFLKDRYHVAAATSGARALEMIQAHKPDLVLLDVNMPEMNGYEVCRRIRIQDKILKVIFVSANDTTAEILKGYDVGGNDYVVKPFAPDILLSKIDQAVRSNAEIAHMSEEAAGLAMEAMTSMGELGAVLTFLRSSFRATNIDNLAALIMGYMANFGLIVCLQLRTENDKKNYTNQGEITPLEEELLSRIAKMNGRFAENGARMFINYDHASLILKNMPNDDEFKMGRLRDNLALLLEGANEKLSLLALEEETETALAFVHQTHQKIGSANKMLIEKTAKDIESSLLSLGVPSEQKDSVTDIVKQNQNEFEKNFEAARVIEEQLEKILKRLHSKYNEPPPMAAGSIDFL